MSKEEFYNKNSIVVTDKKFIVASTTYVLANVTSVGIGKEFKLESLPNVVKIPLFIITGLIWLYSLLFSFWRGLLSGDFIPFLILIVVSIFLYKYMPKNYSVILRTAGNEKSVYSSKDKQEVMNIINALNEAIATDNTSNNESSSSSIADELQKLAKLKNDGILTEEEFETQKRKLLIE